MADAGLTPEDMASRLRKSYRQIGRYLNGQLMPDRPLLDAWSVITRKDVSDLLGETVSEAPTRRDARRRAISQLHLVSPSDQRPQWDDYFMEIVEVVAKRSTCLRRKVGCILVRDRRILATGYNGPPKGITHCGDMGGCMRDRLGIPSGERLEVCRALHAEQNAIIQAAVSGVSLEGEVELYCLTQPCLTCAKMLINANVRRIVYRDAYHDDIACAMLQDGEVAMVKWKPPARRAN